MINFTTKEGELRERRREEGEGLARYLEAKIEEKYYYFIFPLIFFQFPPTILSSIK